MSFELLDDSLHSYRGRSVVHTAGHDLESFMACFFHLVFTSQGCAGMRRKEMDDIPSEYLC